MVHGSRSIVRRSHMTYLILNIILSSSFIPAIRWVQRRHEDILTVGAINYIVAGACAGLLFFGGNNTSYGKAACLTGAANGVAYFISFFLLLASTTRKGAAITAVIARLSVLLPIACGVLIWNEQPSPGQWFGIGLACASLMLLGRPGTEIADGNSSWSLPLILFAFFLVAGSARLAQEAFKHEANHVELEQPTYLLAGFGLTAGASLLMMLARVKCPSLNELAIGSFVGLANFLQTWFILKALERYDGFFVFPIVSAGGLFVTTLIAVILLGERPTRLNYIGIGIGVCSVALLQGAGR